MILNELKTNEHTDMYRGSGTDRQTDRDTFMW